MAMIPEEVVVGRVRLEFTVFSLASFPYRERSMLMFMISHSVCVRKCAIRVIFRRGKYHELCCSR